MTSCSLVHMYRHVRATCCLQLPHHRWGGYIPPTMVNMYQTIRSQTPEKGIFIVEAVEISNRAGPYWNSRTVVTVQFQILAVYNYCPTAVHNCITDENTHENKEIFSFFFLSFFLEVIWREISHLKAIMAQAGTLCQFTSQK